MYKVLVADKLADSAIEHLNSRENFIVDVKTGLSEDELVAIIAEYHAIFVRSATKVTSSILDAAEHLKVIGRAGSGLDNIDVKHAQSKGITVFNTPGSNSQAVAELAIGLIFASSRRLYHAVDSLKAEHWEKATLIGSEVKGKTLGLIGFGPIGQKVGEMAAGSGMRIIVHKKQPLTHSPGYEFEMVSLETLYTKSDYISLHIPKDEHTADLISLEEIKKMKPTAFLINCARGGIINEQDLLYALQNDLIAGAALDVYKNEPPMEFDLINHDKIIATPHIGGSTYESQERVGIDIVDLIVDFLETKYVFI